jgi:O-antigen ligase/tetratricopeptide (TPR) repeat protein
MGNRKFRQRADKIIFRIFLFILIFSPLAFGTVEPWSFAVMESLSLLAFFLFLLRKKHDRHISFYEVPGLVALALICAFIFAQLVPLPPGIMKIISPGTYNLYSETVFAGGPVRWMPLSIDVKATLSEFFRVVSYAVFYVLTVQLVSKKENLKKAIAAVVIFASVLSFLAILQHILWNGKIYWVRNITQGGSPFGPYVNRNHYAGLMEMIFPLVLSLFLFYKPHIAYKSLRDKLTRAFDLKSTNIYLLLGFSAVLIATSVFLTLSRSGIVSLSVSLLFFGLMFLARGKDRKRGIVIIVICVLVILSVGWFGWEPVFERFEKIRNPQGDISELRLVVWNDSRNIIRDFPLFGTGAGSFVDIYPKYRTIPGDRIVDHAHNDYIELLSDGGVVAFALCAWFFVLLLFRSFGVFRKRSETYSVYVFIGCVTGIISILVHSITDFNLHIGANGLYLFFLAALAVSAANTRLREGLNDTYLKKMRMPYRVVVPFAGVILLGCLIFNVGNIGGSVFFSSVKETKLSGKTSRQDLVSVRDAICWASFLDPLEAKYRYAAGNVETLLLNNGSALSLYEDAVRLCPANGEYLQRLGLVMSGLKRYREAGQLLRCGIKYDVSNPERYRTYAAWLFSMGNKEEGIRVVRKSVSMEPHKTREYITLMVLSGLNDDEIPDALPERVEPHLIFADYLQKVGRDGMAEAEYLNALHYLKNEDTINPSFFYQVSGYYMKKGRISDALSIMRKGMEFLPDNAGIRLTAAALYEKAGEPYEAIEEYRKALSIDPRNSVAKKRLDDLLLKTGGS